MLPISERRYLIYSRAAVVSRLAAAPGREAEQAAGYSDAKRSRRRVIPEEAAGYENSEAPACSANSTNGCGTMPKKIVAAAAISAGATR